MTEIDLMTPMERKRKERNEAIIAEFKELAPKLTAQGMKPYCEHWLRSTESPPAVSVSSWSRQAFMRLPRK